MSKFWPLLTALLVASPVLAALLDKPQAAQDKFLPVDQAFVLQPAEWHDGTLVVAWRIAPGYYLYRSRLHFELLEPKTAVRLGTPKLPAGEQHEEEGLGTVEVYRQNLQAEFPVTGAPTGKLSVQVRYQGCADAGLCYPSQTRVLQVTVK